MEGYNYTFAGMQNLYAVSEAICLVCLFMNRKDFIRVLLIRTGNKCIGDMFNGCKLLHLFI